MISLSQAGHWQKASRRPILGPSPWPKWHEYLNDSSWGPAPSGQQPRLGPRYADGDPAAAAVARPANRTSPGPQHGLRLDFFELVLTDAP